MKRQLSDIRALIGQQIEHVAIPWDDEIVITTADGVLILKATADGFGPMIDEITLAERRYTPGQLRRWGVITEPEYQAMLSE